MFSYYNPDADIAWFPTGESNDAVSERVPTVSATTTAPSKDS